MSTISDAEAKTRAAIVWARQQVGSGPLIRCPAGMLWVDDGIRMRDGRRIELPSLYHCDREHEVVVTLTRGGTIVRIIDAHHSGWSSTVEMRLPSEFKLEAA